MLMRQKTVLRSLIKNHFSALIMARGEQLFLKDHVTNVTLLNKGRDRIDCVGHVTHAKAIMVTAQQDGQAFYLIDTRNPAKPMLVPVMRLRKNAATGD